MRTSPPPSRRTSTPSTTAQRAAHARPTGVHAHKIATSDGWWITPAECLAALDAYERSPWRRHVTRVLPDPEERRVWSAWLRMLRLGANGSGLHVH